MGRKLTSSVAPRLPADGVTPPSWSYTRQTAAADEKSFVDSTRGTRDRARAGNADDVSEGLGREGSLGIVLLAPSPELRTRPRGCGLEPAGERPRRALTDRPRGAYSGG